MPAIVLNLLIEEQLAQRAEARDPFKLAVAIGVGLLSASVIVGVFVGQAASKKRLEANELQKRWDTLYNTQESQPGVGTKGLKMLVDDLLAINKGRHVFGPQMALIKDIVPETIQLTQVSFTLAQQETAPAFGGGQGADGTGKPKASRAARARPADHLMVLLDGRALCARPELEVDQFIKSIDAHPVLGPLVKDVRLRSFARAPVTSESANAGVPGAVFVIECEYKEGP